MIEHEHRGLHWRSTQRNALIAIVGLILMLLVASLFTGLFAHWHFLGFPFSYYFAAQGAFILMIALVFWAGSRQEQIDRRHGAAEEL